MEKLIYKQHTNCRACSSTDLIKYLDLGLVPLANNLENTPEEALNAERYPLQVMFCEDCGLSQLSIVVDPEKLFSHYVYRSSVNGGYVKHCREMAKTLKERFGLNKNSLVVDVAGNDGTLLKEFREEIGCEVVNVDPAQNLCAIAARDNNIYSIVDFWSPKIASLIKVSHFKEVDLITATNVFAHVDNIEEFLQAAKIALKPDGILIIECPYVIDHIEKMEWTQVYFEHLSYMSVGPILSICEDIGLRLIDVEKQAIHGGTIRLTVIHDENHTVKSVKNRDNYLDYEFKNGYWGIKIYKDWAKKVWSDIEDLDEQLYRLRYKKLARIAAFSASAKGNTLLNCLKLTDKDIDYIVDETPEKQGKFSPGTGIEIVDMERLRKDPPDYLLLLSWNFKDEIMNKCRSIGYKGRFIIPIPKFEIVD